MTNLNELMQHLESNFKSKGKDFTYEFNENIQILRNVKNDVSTTVGRIFEYDTKPDVVLGITPFRDDTEDKVFATALTAHVHSNLKPENFRNVEPQYAVCVNPLAITSYIEERGFSSKKEQFIKGLLAEELSHLTIDEKYNFEKIQLEIHTSKTFKGKPIPVLDVLDYIYILQGKSEAAAMYVANQVAGMRIYTPKQILKEISKVEERPENYFIIGGRLGGYFSKTFAANILEEIKDEQAFRRFLSTIGEVTKKDIELMENPPQAPE